jgi:DNA invertase Pin-like site-specific DNA recombinase
MGQKRSGQSRRADPAQDAGARIGLARGVGLVLLAAAVLAVVLASAAVATAPAAADQVRPAPLWSAYPLDEPAPMAKSGYRGPAIPAPPTSSDLFGEVAPAPAPTSQASTGSDWPASNLAIIALLAVLAPSLAILLLRWRSGPRASASVAPAPMLGPTFTVALAPPAPLPMPDPVAARAGPAPGRGATVLGYVSLASAEQELEVPGVVEQEMLIRERCQHEGWRLEQVLCDEPEAPGNGRRREALATALEWLADQEAPCLLVSGFDRLGRSARELGETMAELRAVGATVVSMEHAIDTASVPGGLVAEVLSGVGAGEGERIAAGTRNGHALARAEGRPISRPAVTDVPVLQERIAAMRADGMTLQAIADQLNAEGVPTVRGGALWRPSSVQVAAGYKRPRRRAREPR